MTYYIAPTSDEELNSPPLTQLYLDPVEPQASEPRPPSVDEEILFEAGRWFGRYPYKVGIALAKQKLREEADLRACLEEDALEDTEATRAKREKQNELISEATERKDMEVEDGFGSIWREKLRTEEAWNRRNDEWNEASEAREMEVEDEMGHEMRKQYVGNRARQERIRRKSAARRQEKEEATQRVAETIREAKRRRKAKVEGEPEWLQRVPPTPTSWDTC